MKKDDIHVSIDGNMVSISAEVKHEKETTDGGRMLRSERCYDKVMRSFRLDQDVLEDKAMAKYTDGVLELTLPKKNGIPHRELAISRAKSASGSRWDIGQTPMWHYMVFLAPIR